MIKNARNPYSSFRRPYDQEHPIPIPKMVDLSDNEEVRLYLGGLDSSLWGAPPSETGGDTAGGGTDWNKVFDTINKAATTVGTVLEATRKPDYNPQPTGGGGFYPDNSGSDQKQDPNMKLYIIIGAVLFSILLLIVLIKAIKK